ncbi:MAG: zf-HC2 domain-containing protein [Xanthobacteraceae bacterium]
MTLAEPGKGTEIELLLPWYAAGTLSGREVQRVEAALAGDPELSRRYELVRHELSQTIALNEALGAPSVRAMDALFAKIAAEPVRNPRSLPDWGGRLRAFLAGLSPRTLVWSASVATCAIVVEAAVIAGIMVNGNGGGPAASYQAASARPSSPTAGSYALIRFQPQANAADIGKFLASNKITLSGGPSAGGLYRVEVAPKKLSQPEVADILKKLQGSRVVDFIAPTQ